MILTELNANECARVIQINGGNRLRQELCLRGLSEGCKLRTISCSHGPVLVEIKGTTLALGRGMAQKIMVKRLDK